MSRLRQQGRVRAAPLAALVLLLALAPGCTAFAEHAGPQDAEQAGAEVLDVGVPLREPVWVPEEQTLLALAEDEPRLLLVDPGSPGSTTVTHARTLPDVGENVALSVRSPGRAYLPRPKQRRIDVVSTRDLHRLQTLPAPVPPAQVSVDAASEILFTLDSSGTTVAGRDLEHSEWLPQTTVDPGEQAVLEAPEKGLDPAFWVAGRGGLANYGGSPPELRAGLGFGVADLVADPDMAQRAYVISEQSPRVRAVAGDPAGLTQGVLEVVAERTLAEPVDAIAVGDLFVYAVTEHRFVALRRHDLALVASIAYRRSLPPTLARAPVTGLVVGGSHVYATLEGEPRLLRFVRP